MQGRAVVLHVAMAEQLENLLEMAAEFALHTLASAIVRLAQRAIEAAEKELIPAAKKRVWETATKLGGELSHAHANTPTNVHTCAHKHKHIHIHNHDHDHNHNHHHNHTLEMMESQVARLEGMAAEYRSNQDEADRIRREQADLVQTQAPAHAAASVKAAEDCHKGLRVADQVIIKGPLKFR